MGKTTRLKGAGARHIDAGLQRPTRPRGETLNMLGALVYAVRTPDALIKIGFTRSLAQRSATLGGINAILAVRLGSTLADEQALHDSLAESVARGREYYHPTTEVLDVVNTMRSDMGMPPVTAEDIAA